MRRIVPLLTAMVLLLGMLAPAPASASNLFGDACSNSSGKDSAICQNGKTSSNPLTGKNGIIVKITRFIAFVSGIAAVIIIMISGLNYINSAGDPTKATKARSGIIYAIAGLIVIISAQFIISLIMSRI